MEKIGEENEYWNVTREQRNLGGNVNMGKKTLTVNLSCDKKPFLIKMRVGTICYCWKNRGEILFEELSPQTQKTIVD